MTLPLTFRATNDLGEADTTLAITVSVSPSWTTLTSQSWVLDDAITNINLNNSVTGDGTITISLQSGTLPDGISLSSGVLSGTPTDATQDGSVVFRATSTHGTDDTTLNYVINAYPSWTTLSDVTWVVGTAITDIDLNDSVTGDGTITFSLQSGTLPDGITLSSGVLSGAPTDYSDDVTLTFRATSVYGMADTDLEVTILALPSITAIANVSIIPNDDVSIMFSVTGDPIPSFTVTGLPTGVTHSDGIISGSTSVVGVYNVTVTATNSQGSDTETFSITVAAELTVPQITSISDFSYAYNESITAIAVTVTGNPTPSVTVSGLPAGLAYSGGEITGMSTVVGTHEIIVTATNSEGDATVTFDVTIAVELIAPAITAISDVVYNSNQAITTITVSVTGNPTPTVTVAGLPAGITYENGVITGMSTVIGTHEIIITATNSEATVTEIFDITISAPPSWTALTSQSWLLDDAITNINLNNSVTGDGTITISLQSGTLPDGISLSNGVLSGTPTDATQDGSVTFRATSAHGTADTTLSYVINAYPVWTALSDVFWVEGTAISSIDLNDSVTGDGTITISLQSGTLPDGLALSSGVLFATPTDATQDGILTFRATSTYGTADTTLNFTIYSIPSWTTLSDVSWTAGTAIADIDLNNSVSGDGPIAITLQSGTLPDGISLSSGVLSGTATDATDRMVA